MLVLSPTERRLLKIADRVFIKGDTTTIRVLLGFGSLGWAVLLWLPLHTFDRPTYLCMKQYANEWVWGGLFLAHFVGVMWRIIDTTPRIGAGFAVNAYGIALWTLTSYLIARAVGEVSPAQALEWTLILAAVVALFRTGLNDEVVSP